MKGKKGIYYKRKLFYIDIAEGIFSYKVMHRQFIGNDKACAYFNFDFSVSKSRAFKAAKVFCKTMNDYYPNQPKF